MVKVFVQPKAGLPYEARKLTTTNMEEVARWTGGQIKGTKLPPEVRRVEWYDQHFDGGMDIGARVGQWIIKWGAGFHVCSQEQFDQNFVVTKVE